MPLNLLKVQKLLYSAGFIIDTYFIVGKQCQYVKCSSIITGDSLVLHIASGYDFIVDTQASNAHIIRLIDFDAGDNVAEKYGDYPDKKELSDRYGQSLKLSGEMNDDELEAEMENNYKKTIDLKCMEREQIMIIKDCFRQLKRLALSMQGIRYSVCIFQDKYFSIVDEDLVDCYYIKNFSTDSRRLFFVVCDLEYFYEKMSNINTDIETIKTSIYRLLDKNAETNIDTLSKIMKRLLTTDMSDKEINKKKTEYIAQIQRYKTQLDEFSKNERQIMSEMKGEKSTEGGFFNDTAYINKKAGLQAKLDSIDNERQKVIRVIVELRQKCDSIYLNTDKIEFDNCILANGISKNFIDLDTVLKTK